MGSHQDSYDALEFLTFPNGAPMGLQWGQIGENNLGEVLLFSYFFNAFYGICWVYNYTQMAIKVPGPIPILFG